MHIQDLWKNMWPFTSENDVGSAVDRGRNMPRAGFLKALFHGSDFDDYFAECNPLPSRFFIAERLTFPSSKTTSEGAMLNIVITFFLLAVIAAVFGFGGLAGTFAAAAKLLAVVFVAMFILSLVYSVVSGRRPNLPDL